ncbi:hypothetical protein COY05_05365 [Candidatus Peregrinibacteria bacterium CG_4_10_14_0_2_um_filter_38_24]|nr:MAG: hypothetical protein COY05_05365 [Candidatus Peregrinibacteria bacterium CG_4_10_14_0_2_um_filter_38_24]PJC38931.1 MAG: hypothetical protein CO044_02415 [Candidatus Peregrinibacteria bacterium CG_4_9_14_0_2_um_filter_38_9]
MFGDLGEMTSSSTQCKAAPLKITIKLTDESAFLFLKLKKKFEVSSGKFRGNREVMNEILKRLVDMEFPEKVVAKNVDQRREKVILEDNFFIRDGIHIIFFKTKNLVSHHFILLQTIQATTLNKSQQIVRNLFHPKNLNIPKKHARISACVNQKISCQATRS